jgi:hypothetical protein
MTLQRIQHDTLVPLELALLHQESFSGLQNTHPAGTRPVRPSGVGSGMGASNGTTPTGADAENVMATGGVLRSSAAVRAAEASDQRARRDMGAILPGQLHGGNTLALSARRLGSGRPVRRSRSDPPPLEDLPD